MERKLSERQRWAWLLSALSAPTAICACGLSWLWVLAAGLAAAGYNLYMVQRLPQGGLAVFYRSNGVAGQIFEIVTLLWLVFTMGWAANLADSAFPMVEGFPVLGWTMLALAAWGSWKGAAACGRCCGVLCLFLMALYGIVVVFAAPEVQWANLVPIGGWSHGVKALGVFLLPMAVWLLPGRRREKATGWGLGIAAPILATLLAAVTAGVLSPQLSGALPSPLYTLAQSVSLFGVIERIEPMLSAAMTMGVFCLLSAMACGCRSIFAQWRPWKFSGIVCCAAAAGVMRWAGKTEIEALTAGSVLIWVVIPVILLEIGIRKRKGTPRNGG